MSHIPEPAPLLSLTPAAVLMTVLDVIESPSMVESVEEAGGINRPDGVRAPGWQLRFNLGHLAPDRGTWMEELDHAVLHAQASRNADDLQAALRVIAAVAVSWDLALGIRAQGDQS